MKKPLMLLFLILIIGTVLRFYNLGQIPAGFHRDEAYFGYTAYSLLKSGMDMTGNFLPLNLESVLFSPAGYSYFSIPFIFLFGLNEFSVRFAAALFGSLTIVLTYYFVKEIFNQKSETLALLSAFFLAISPWHINLSRTSAENVIVVFFIISGIIFYKKWVDKNKIYLLALSFLCFLITLYTYQAPRTFLPLFLPLVFFYFSFKDKKRLFISFLAYLIVIIIPVLSVFLSHELSTRYRMLSIFNSPATQLVLDEQLREDGVMNISPTHARVFHNKPFAYFSTFLLNYSDHFSYRFLFTDAGFPDRYRVPGVGLLYIFDLPFLIVGAYILFNKNKKLFAFFLGWILIAPVGSALTYDDVPNLQRTLIAFPAVPIISSLGAVAFVNSISNIKYKTLPAGRQVLNTQIKYLIFSLAFLFLIFNFLYYLHQYYVGQIVHRPWFRQEGYKELISTLNDLDKNNSYKKIVVSEAQSDPSVFFIFFNKSDPLYVQNLFKKVTNGNYGSINLGKIVFSHEECPLKEVVVTDPKTLINTSFIKGELGVLYADNGTCKFTKEGVKILSVIKRNDGTNVFIVAEVEKDAKIYREIK